MQKGQKGEERLFEMMPPFQAPPISHTGWGRKAKFS